MLSVSCNDRITVRLCVRRYVLKNMVRDWGEEGAGEREQSYGRILAELQERFPVSASPSRISPRHALLERASQ